jgi:hypothetical protein
MYGKPHLDLNAHVFAAARAMTEMQQIADDKSLSDLQRQLARQTRDLASSLLHQLRESSNGQS